MRGRKPKPTALKIAEGNPGKRALPADEPSPDPVAPKCPTHLRGEARREWKRLVPLLEELGLISKIDMVAMACYCATWGRHVEAERQLAEQGYIIETDKGNKIPNPLIGVSNTAAKLARSFLIEFGLTPSTRARLHVAPPNKPEDELNDFIQEGNA